MGKLLVSAIAVIAAFAVSFAIGYAVVTLGKAYIAYQRGLVECITRVDHTKTLDLPIRITICRDRDSRDSAWKEWRVITARKDFVGSIYLLDTNLPD